MASGKSSVAEALALRLPKSVHLRGDLFRRMIINGREDMSENPTTEALHQLDMRHALTAQVATEYYNNGFTVVVQDNFLGEKLAYFSELISPYPTYIVVLNPTIDTIKQRENSRHKKGYVGFTVESLHKGFLNETPKIGLWLDTSNMTIDQTVDEIEDRVLIEGFVPSK